jgi:hypothetical protein
MKYDYITMPFSRGGYNSTLKYCHGNRQQCLTAKCYQRLLQNNLLVSSETLKSKTSKTKIYNHYHYKPERSKHV